MSEEFTSIDNLNIENQSITDLSLTNISPDQIYSEPLLIEDILSDDTTLDPIPMCSPNISNITPFYKQGIDGQTLYVWIKFADTPNSGMSDISTGKDYLGIAVNKPSQTESLVYSDYEWIKLNSSSGSPVITQRLDTWEDYTPDKAGWVLSAYLGNDLNTRVTNLENNPGGVLTPEQLEILSFWKKDPNNPNTIFTERNAYSTGELSAYGIGSGGEGGDGGSISTLSDVLLTSLVAGHILRYNGTHWVNEVFNPTTSWSSITNKPTTLGGFGINSSDTLFDNKYANLSAFNSHAGNTSVHLSATERTALQNLMDWWKLDASGNLYTEKNLYSTLEVSAYGAGSGGSSGGGGSISTLSDVQLTSPVSGNILQFNGTHWINIPFSPVLSWDDIINKPLLYTPSAHTHIISDITGLQTALDAKASSTHTHTFASLTSKPTTLAGYGITDAFKTLRYTTDLDAVTESGIYRQETPSSGFSYTTTLNLSSFDGRQQLTIARDGSAVKFRGVNSESGTTGWTGWKTVYHSGNLSPVTTNTVQTITAKKTFTDALSVTTIGSKFGPNDGITSLPALGTEGNTFGIGGFYGFRFNVLSNGNGNLQIGRFSEGAIAYNLILQSQGGNVGIGEPSPSVKLHVAGNILSSGEITAYVASDRRLKENIKPIISALDYINKLNPVSYNWNARAKELNPMKSDNLDYGLIAQEVENVLPGVVHGIFDDKYKSIDYIKLIPIMIAAIKELKQKVNKL